GDVQIYMNGQAYQPPKDSKVVFINEERVTISTSYMSPEALMEYFLSGGDPSSLSEIQSGIYGRLPDEF
ncbi:MAG: hypothetical protein AAF483_25760, partial [Planctomycetota bacterium]